MLVDPSAPFTVALGSAASSALAAVAVSTYATLKRTRTPPGTLAGLTALNTGILSATVLSLREYLVSPCLLSAMSTGEYARRKQVMEADHTDNSTLARRAEGISYSDMRAHKTLDTGLSGAIAGGVFRGWKHGWPKVMRGATTGALVCAALQYLCNEAEVARVKYVSSTLPVNRNNDEAPIPTTTAQGDAGLPAASNTEMALPAGGRTSQPAPPAKSFSERFFDRFEIFQKIPDDQYLSMLKRKRDGCLSRMDELRALIEEEKRKRGQ